MFNLLLKHFGILGQIMIIEMLIWDIHIQTEIQMDE